MSVAHPTVLALGEQARADLATATDLEATREWYRQYLGDNGSVSGLTKQIGTLPPDQRRAFGIAVNALKNELAAALAERQTALETTALDARIASEAIDVTLPGRPVQRGTLHPTTLMIREFCEIFGLMGFQTVEGPEVEDANYNFDYAEHPGGSPRARHLGHLPRRTSPTDARDRPADAHLADAGADDAVAAAAGARRRAGALLPLRGDRRHALAMFSRSRGWRWTRGSRWRT